MPERKQHVVLSRSQKAAIIAECTRRDEEGHKWNLADVSAWAERKFDLPGRPHIATICRIRRDAPKILGGAHNNNINNVRLSAQVPPQAPTPTSSNREEAELQHSEHPVVSHVEVAVNSQTIPNHIVTEQVTLETGATTTASGIAPINTTTATGTTTADTCTSPRATNAPTITLTGSGAGVSVAVGIGATTTTGTGTGSANGSLKRRASDEPGETTENDSVSPIVAPMAGPMDSSATSAVAAAAAAAAAAIATQPPNGRKRTRRKSSIDELRRWKQLGCEKATISALGTSEVAAALAAYLVNYEDEMINSFEVLCEALTRRFRQNFLFGTAFADANKEGREQLVSVVMKAVAEVSGENALFGLTNRTMRFINQMEA